MNKKEYEKQIAEMQEQFDKMQKQLDVLKQVKIEEPKERWKPKIDETYYYLHSFGIISSAIWDNNGADNWRYLTGNVFKTEQEAKEYRKKLEIQAQFKNLVEERTEELDWKNENQNKYLILYDYQNNSIVFSWNNECKTEGSIYASSKQILKDAIAEIGEENIKKYVLEVEDE